MRRMFEAFPGMQPERAAVFSGAFRGVFLTLLMKDEMGADVFDDALRVLVRGVALPIIQNRNS